MNRPKIAIIPAAGLGTRCKPLTDFLPKEMLPLGGKPLIEHVVHEALDLGIEKLLIVINKSKEKIIQEHLYSAFPNFLNWNWVYQHEALGLDHAIWRSSMYIQQDLEKYPENPILIMLPDTICLRNSETLIQKGLRQNMSVLTTRTLENNFWDFGVACTDNKYMIKGIFEKPNIRPEGPICTTVSGRYLLNKDFWDNFDYINFVDGMFLKTLNNLAMDDKLSEDFKNEDKFLDCGTLKKWAQAFLNYGENNVNTRTNY